MSDESTDASQEPPDEAGRSMPRRLLQRYGRPGSKAAAKWTLGIITAVITGVLVTIATTAVIPDQSAKQASPQPVSRSTATSATATANPKIIIATATIGDPNPKACNIGASWVLPKPAAQLPPMPDAQGQSALDSYATYAKQNGGVLAGSSLITVVIQSTRSEAVVLTGLRAVVVQRRPPVVGTVTFRGECGGVSPRWFLVDALDADPIQVVPQDGGNGNEPLPAITFPYTVSATDPEVFQIFPRVISHDVDWYLELTWIADGVRGVTRIDDDGRPFRTTGVSAAQPYYFDRKTGTWRMP